MDNSVFPVQHHRRRQKGFGLAFRDHVLENFDLAGRETVGFQGLPPASEGFFVCRLTHDDSISFLIKFVRLCRRFGSMLRHTAVKRSDHGRSEDGSGGT